MFTQNICAYPNIYSIMEDVYGVLSLLGSQLIRLSLIWNNFSRIFHYQEDGCPDSGLRSNDMAFHPPSSHASPIGGPLAFDGGVDFHEIHKVRSIFSKIAYEPKLPIQLKSLCKFLRTKRGWCRVRRVCWRFTWARSLTRGLFPNSSIPPRPARSVYWGTVCLLHDDLPIASRVAACSCAAECQGFSRYDSRGLRTQICQLATTPDPHETECVGALRQYFLVHLAPFASCSGSSSTLVALERVLGPAWLARALCFVLSGRFLRSLCTQKPPPAVLVVLAASWNQRSGHWLNGDLVRERAYAGSRPLVAVASLGLPSWDGDLLYSRAVFYPRIFVAHLQSFGAGDILVPKGCSSYTLGMWGAHACPIGHKWALWLTRTGLCLG
ncbi:hypothetical protein HNY73_011199 [Argiope bruennichi]|uniref:Uncharacterized protein n=1 Tax=Argiope bruennichi TaxID=94029 RepID=A0A8T0F3C8_ARGBR|nr:hypothetical protein HNY73_011199 [Argiope bruennichi]